MVTINKIQPVGNSRENPNNPVSLGKKLQEEGKKKWKKKPETRIGK